jgi:hypothetical protein
LERVRFSKPGRGIWLFAASRFGSREEARARLRVKFLGLQRTEVYVYKMNMADP